ncbi:MAG: NfeD family protein [Eubacterium sp.]|nr:NfeD family protein [Eubacterium sp.]
MTSAILWLILFIVMLLIEIFTMGLTTIWFCFGGLVAAVTAGLGGPIWLQILLFTLVSVASMLLVRPFALRYMDKNRTKTNIDEAIGQKVRVIETIDNEKETGKVFYRGIEWMARSQDGSLIEAETMVSIQEVSGVKLIVKK